MNQEGEEDEEEGQRVGDVLSCRRTPYRSTLCQSHLSCYEVSFQECTSTTPAIMAHPSATPATMLFVVRPTLRKEGRGGGAVVQRSWRHAMAPKTGMHPHHEGGYPHARQQSRAKRLRG